MRNKTIFQDQVLDPLLSTATRYAANNAFFINESYYSYNRFYEKVSAIRDAVQSLDKNVDNVGLVANDDLETYAAIIALWLDGKSYIPVNPDTPKERNQNVFNQAAVTVVIDSSTEILFPDFTTISSKQLIFTTHNLIPNEVADDALAYIFFTSGTTGVPKGVPITRANLAGFIKAFFALNIAVDATDRCLQMFELTFDLSVMSYLVPLLRGACVYTIPKNKIKFNYIAQLIEEQQLTIALMVPSIIHYLRPYLNEIDGASMKYSLFCGEALPLDITREWANCIPNATIMNVYGPTEDTIFCTRYAYKRNNSNKVSHGLLCIGRAMEGTYTIIINDNNEMQEPGEKGQLCLGGAQLTPGYWKNEEKNKEAFFYIDRHGVSTRFYKTGDLCMADHEGDIMYLGRIDSQVKVQGFRVELSEIEFFAKAYLGKINAVAIPFINKIGNTEIGMVIEAADFDTKAFIEQMKTKMPSYMIPTQIRFETVFPLNTNGKTDRKKMEQLFKTPQNA